MITDMHDTIINTHISIDVLYDPFALSHTMHHSLLNEAYKQAEIAYNNNEVPVGCVITKNGQIISRSHNLTNKNRTPLAHAELNALSDIKCTNGLTFYITCEPCVMCRGILSRINCVVYYGCNNYIFGGTTIHGGKQDWLINLQDTKCFEILQEFFKRENIHAPQDKRKEKGSKEIGNSIHTL